MTKKPKNDAAAWRRTATLGSLGMARASMARVANEIEAPDLKCRASKLAELIGVLDDDLRIHRGIKPREEVLWKSTT